MLQAYFLYYSWRWKYYYIRKATRIHDKCKELSHSSVFEHCARAMSEVEYTASKSTGYTRKEKTNMVGVQ